MQESKDNNIPSWENIESSDSYKNLDYPSRMKIRAGYFDDTASKNPNYLKADRIKQAEIRNGWMSQEAPPVAAPDDSNFIPGIQRGLQNLEAMNYGAVALAGKGLKALGADNLGKDIFDYGVEGYRRNVNEAKQYPKKHSFKDVYTGKAGWGGSVDWAQGTLGELVPSMAEAAIGSLVGAAMGSAIGPEGTIGGGAIGGFAGRTFLKKAIDKGVEEAAKQGLGALGKKELRKQVTTQALKKLGGKVGIGAAVMPMESGGMYASLLEERGIDAPETAMFLGALSTALEFAGGNSRLVDTFVDALSKNKTELVKKTAKELIRQPLEEAGQEGGQEIFGILNNVINTDDKLLTADHVEQVIESMAAGALGGGAGAVVSGTFNKQANNDNSYEGQLKTKVDNIIAQGTDKIPASINALDQEIIKNDQLLQSQETLDALAAESGNDVNDLTNYIKMQNDFNQELKTRLQAELDNNSQATEVNAQEDQIVKDIGTAIKQQQEKDAAQITAANQQMQDLDLQIDQTRNAYLQSTDPKEKLNLEKQLLTLVSQKKSLLGDEVQKKQFNKQSIDALSKEEEQDKYDDLFGAISVNKDAQESAQVFKDKLEDEVITQAGQPYQNRKVLENRLAKLPDASQYMVVKTQNGFIGIKKVSPEVEASTFKDEQPNKIAKQVKPVEQVEPPKQVTAIDEINNQLALNNQQLDSLAEQINNTSDPNEQLVLRQEGALIYEQNAALQNQLAQEKRLQEQTQREDFTTPVTAENANISPQFQVSDAQATNNQIQITDQQGHDETYVKDAEGNDLIGFHGTSSAPFKTFDNNQTQKFEHGWAGDGHYFTVRKNYAQNYADAAENTTGNPGRLVKARFSFKNPLYKPSSEYDRLLQKAIGKDTILNKEDGVKATQAFKNAGYDAVIQGKSIDNSFEINVFDSKNIHYAPGENQFQVANTQTNNQIQLTEVEKLFPKQEVIQGDDGKISVKFKNGKGLTIQGMHQADNGFIKLAIDTGQMSKNGKILGITTGTEILLDENFADNKTLWHENKHVLDNLGMITKADNAALNKEFNKLRKSGKLEFALSTHEDPIQRMIENRANMFAQIMTNREAYRNTPFGKVIQRVMDFFQQLLAMGQQTISGLARETETGKLYERQIGNNIVQTTVPQAETTAQNWYSALEKAVENTQAKQAPASQWKGMIKNFPGIKQAELDWTEVNEWLDEQQGKVTKDDLLKYIQENNVQLEEVIYPEQKRLSSLSNRELTQIEDKIDVLENKKDSLVNQIREYVNQHSFYDLVLQADQSFVLQDRNGQFFELFDQPNIDPSLQRNIHAVEFQLDQYSKKIEELKIESEEIIASSNYRTKHDIYQLPGGENYKELLITAPKIPGEFVNDAHFNEPNILAHVRFNTRTDSEGNKVLFIEEVQSDWHQKGRKEGYGDKVFHVQKQNTDGSFIGKFFPINQQDQAEQYAKEINGTIDKVDNPYDTGVPNAPFKGSKNWAMLAMKRMVRYAAENGYDKIAWTTGEQQNDRYDLSKQITGISYRDAGNGEYDVKVNNGSEIVGRKKDTPEELESYIGEELTQKIVNGSGEVLNDGGLFTHRLSGLDLKVGGEGMIGFYDKMLPSMLNKEFNRGKWGKAKVAVSNINNKQQLSLPITKRMRDKALREGMPKFQIDNLGKRIVRMPQVYLDKVKEITNTEAFKNWFGNSKITSNGQPHILYHGTNDSQFLQNPNTDWSFDTSRKPSQSSSPLAGLGIFLGNDTIASAHAGEKGTVHPFFVKVENPYVTTADELEQSINSHEDAKAMKKRLQELGGYDGIILKDRGQVIAFEPAQLKSVTDNKGTFDPNNSDVRFQVSEPTKQKLTDKQYTDSFKRKNNIIQDLKQLTNIRGHELKLIADKLAGPISTRLANANPLLRDKMRRMDFDVSQKIISALHVAKPLLEKTKQMSSADKHIWDLARKQADTIKVNQIAERYNMTDDMEKLRETLNNIREQAKDVGYEVGYIDEYWPRIIKDQAGFLKATQEIADRPEFTEALKAKAKQMGITFEELNRDFPDVRADVINNMILGRGSGIGGPGNIKSRKYETIPPELEKYYMNSDAALMQYIYSMTKKIEARKFFGKVPPKIQAHKLAITKAQKELNTLDNQAIQNQDNPEIMQIIEKRQNDLNDQITLHQEALDKYKDSRDYTENIGAYIDELMIKGDLHPKDEKAVRDILEARFNEHGTSGAVSAFKNLSYIDVMGNPISALTQIGDLAWAAYVGKAWTPKGFSHTVKNAINATLKKSKITKEDLGIERIAQEFADGTTLSNAVNYIFNKVGLTKIDSIGKETLINNALMNYQDQIKSDSGRKALAKEINPMFGAQTAQVIKDLASSDINSDTISENVKLLLYSKLLNFQPAALSEMPEMYLKGGQGRVFYMLKTYTIKQMDVFRNEVVHDIRSNDPKRIMTGIGNMVKLLSMLTLANAGADELKDFVLGKDVKFKDNVIENLLTIGGASKYMRMQVTREGIGNAMAQKILPPFKFINSGFSDIKDKIVTGDVDKGLRSVDSIPGAGKWYYWRYGRGSNYKKTFAEQDFAKDSKRFNKFNKQFEKASDKRLFLQTNIDEFKQVKLHRYWQSKLNKNKATINKLEKLKQTPAVIKRLGQLEKQRKLFYTQYFIQAKQLARG